MSLFIRFVVTFLMFTISYSYLLTYRLIPFPFVYRSMISSAFSHVKPIHRPHSILFPSYYKRFDYCRLLMKNIQTSISSTKLPSLLDISIWDVYTRCVVLEIPIESLVESYGNHEQEKLFLSNLTTSMEKLTMKTTSAMKQSNKQYNTFLGGRQALRQAFASMNYELIHPILKDEHGAPIILPMDIKGSISHKDKFVVGLGSLLNKGKIGVDLERCRNKAVGQLQRKLLTEKERQSLGMLTEVGISIEEEVLLRFSMKEAVYKALHPYLLRPIGFHEAEIYPQRNGSATIDYLLDKNQPNINKEIKYQASWLRFQSDYWLTVVRIWLD